MDFAISNLEREIEEKIDNGEMLSNKRMQYESPLKKYVLSITPVAFKEDSRYWAFTIGKVYKKAKSKTGSLIATIHRNSEKFPYAFFEIKKTDMIILFAVKTIKVKL